jgi:hypothetical protein
VPMSAERAQRVRPWLRGIGAVMRSRAHGDVADGHWDSGP